MGSSMQRDIFRDKVRSMLLNKLGGNFGIANSFGGRSGSQSGGTRALGGSIGGATGPTIGGTSVSMMGGRASGAESFGEKKKRQALYGKYGKGGLLREQMGLGATLKREELGSKEKIAGIGAGATTGAAKIRGDASKAVATTQAGKYGATEDEYGNKQGFYDRQLKARERLGIAQNQTKRDFPNIRQQQPRPQFIPGVPPLPGEPDSGTKDRMFGRNPATGNYDISNVPKRTMEYRPGRDDASTENMPYDPSQAGRRQDLGTGFTPFDQARHTSPKAYYDDQTPEMQERIRNMTPEQRKRLQEQLMGR